MANSSATYNNDIRGNLPVGISYDSTRFRFFVNGKPFHNYTNAYWYWRYILKFGWTGAGDYSANGYHPALVGDFVDDIFWEREQMPLQPLTFDDLFTHSRLGNATMVDSDGLLKWGPHNLITYSDDLASGSYTAYSGGVLSGSEFTFTNSDSHLMIRNLVGQPTKAKFTLKATISGGTAGDTFSLELVDSADGSDSHIVTVTVSETPTEYTVEADFSPSSTFSGNLGVFINRTSPDRSVTAGSKVTLEKVHLYRSDLGGMAPVPVDARVAGSTTYVPTTSTAKYLPRRHNHVYDGSVAKWNLHNLLTYSEQFDNAAWSKVSSGTGTSPVVTANAGVAPDGTTTADRIYFDRGAGTTSADISYVNQAMAYGAITGTYRVWIKSYTGVDQEITIRLGTALFDYAVVATSEWQLFEVSGATTVDRCQLLLYGHQNPETADILVWGAHLYRSDLNGMEATGSPYPTYLATTGTAVEPTLSDVSWVDAGTLIETEARTNLITYSEDFSTWGFAGAGTGSNVVVTASAETDPAGGTGAYQLDMDLNGGVTSSDRSYISSSATISSGIDYTASVWVKSADASSYDIHISIAGGGPVVATVGQEWQRINTTWNSTITSGSIRIGLVGNQATSDSASVLVYGAQLEAGSTPSSYIPTNGAASTRAADTSGLTIPAYSTTRTTGSELVVNGTFDTDSDWTKGTGWTISGGVATFDASATAGVESVLQQTISVTDGVPHHVTVTFSDLTNLSGSELLVRVDGANLVANETGSANITSDGTYTFTFTPSASTSSLAIRLSVLTEGDETGTIDNISVKEAARIAPWPTPRVIGDELVANGGFDSDISGWTDGSTGTGSIAWDADQSLEVIGVDSSNRGKAYQAFATTAGKVYRCTFDVVETSTGNSYPRIGTAADGDNLYAFPNVATGSYEGIFVATGSTAYFTANVSGGTFNYDNVSVKEIDPLVVAIQMKGRMDYADDDSFATVSSVRWYSSSSEYIYMTIDTATTYTGRPKFHHTAGGVVDSVSGSSAAYTPGINVPFNIASYHGSTFVNGAVDGTALTADTTPVALPDLSGTDLQIGYDFMGNIEEVRIWVDGITDVTSGNLLISEASS